MSQPSDPEAVSEQEAEALIERLQQDALSAQDKVVITKVIRSYLYLALMVQQTGVKLKQVRQFLFGSFKKKDQGQNGVTDTVKGDNAHEAVAHPETETSDAAARERPLTERPNEDTRKKKPSDKPTVPGHGRLSAQDYTGATQRQCRHPLHQVGDLCPVCHTGKLYPYKTKQQIQLHGHAPVSATCWLVEVLRCATCKALFNAREQSPKYDASVKTSIVLSRYYLGLPFYRLDGFQRLVGVPLPDSTQWDLVEALFEIVFPVFVCLARARALAALALPNTTADDQATCFQSAAICA